MASISNDQALRQTLNGLPETEQRVREVHEAILADLEDAP